MPLAPAARLCICVAALLSSACASAPKESFYTLSPAALPAGTGTDARYSVSIGPVRIPEMVDRPQFVIRRGANEVEIVEQQRWAQSLRTEIARALSYNLSGQLPQARIMINSDSATNYRISVDVEQFDAIPGEGVVVQALWTVRGIAGSSSRTGQSAIREPATAGGYDELAAAYGRAIARMSVAIANAVLSLRPDDMR